MKLIAKMLGWIMVIAGLGVIAFGMLVSLAPMAHIGGGSGSIIGGAVIIGLMVASFGWMMLFWCKEGESKK